MSEIKYHRKISITSKIFNIKFIKSLRTLRNPYGNGLTSKKSIKIITKTNFKKLLIKKFYLVK